MFTQAFKQAFSVITKKPLRLWGLSLLSGLICCLASAFTLFIPIVGITFTMVLSAGMSKVYLDGIDGNQVYSDQLFYGFRSGKAFFRTAGGLAWQSLWTIIWVLASIAAGAVAFLIFAIIPFIGPYIGGFAFFVVYIAGIVLSFMKSYSYSFVPYILMTNDDITATEALRVSMKKTNGKKLQLWLADLVFGLVLGFGSLILGLLALIPFIGKIFIVLLIAVWVLAPLFQGLYKAALYKMPQPKVANNAAQRLENIVNQ